VIVLSSTGSKLWAWGNNNHAQLTLGDTETHMRPVVVIPEELDSYKALNGTILSAECGYSTTFLFTPS
jgi:alpha-tubulin suppressor-like RCC1 family protein